MIDTSVSLLERLRLQPDAEAWQRLVTLYEPLLNAWLRRYAMPSADAADLVQEVLTVLVRELPEFRHDLRRGAFRRWLRNILLNRLRAFWRSHRRMGDAGFARVRERFTVERMVAGTAEVYARVAAKPRAAGSDAPPMRPRRSRRRPDRSARAG